MIRPPSEADWAAAVELLTSSRDVVLAAHVSPDGDALGSALAVGLALRERGVAVTVSYGDDPFVVPSTLGFLPGLDLLRPPTEVPGRPGVVATFDTGSADRLGLLQPVAAGADALLVIDHHVSNTLFGTHHLVDVSAAATAVLAEELVRRLGVALSPEIATAVYTGLTTDTGSFRFAATTPAVHELAARLLRTGIRHDLIARAVFDTKGFGYLRVLGVALERAQLDPAAAGGLGMIWTLVSAADRARHGVGSDEVESVIGVLRLAQEAEVAVVLKEDDDASLKVSTRSKGALDMSRVCAALGGGGHRYAAGYTSYDDPETTVRRLTAALATAEHLTA